MINLGLNHVTDSVELVEKLFEVMFKRDLYAMKIQFYKWNDVDVWEVSGSFPEDTWEEIKPIVYSGRFLEDLEYLVELVKAENEQ